MQKASFYILFICTCFYFVFAGNPSVFSKLGKDTVAAVCDLDGDSADGETKDSKEDGGDEEGLFFIENTLFHAVQLNYTDLFVIEKASFLPQHIAEKTSPPPKA